MAEEVQQEEGAVVVDKNLKEIGKLNIRGRMPEGEVPSNYTFTH